MAVSRGGSSPGAASWDAGLASVTVLRLPADNREASVVPSRAKAGLWVREFPYGATAMRLEEAPACVLFGKAAGDLCGLGGLGNSSGWKPGWEQVGDGSTSKNRIQA